MTMASNGFVAFMQGFTGAGLFGRLRRPGAPTEFIDSRSVEEYLESGEFERTIALYRAYVPARPKQPDYVTTHPEFEIRISRSNKPNHSLEAAYREGFKERATTRGAVGILEGHSTESVSGRR
jgi:hypothetical protein